MYMKSFIEVMLYQSKHFVEGWQQSSSDELFLTTDNAATEPEPLIQSMLYSSAQL